MSVAKQVIASGLTRQFSVLVVSNVAHNYIHFVKLPIWRQTHAQVYY